MNKEQQIKEIRHILENYIDYMKDECDKCIAACGKYNDTCMAYALYNAGYRKTFTSDFASDTQKAYKEGYIKGIEETAEKPVDTQKKEYESIDDIVRGFVVKDGKLMYITNILDGCRHEFNDIYEICDELNNDMKEIDRLMELNNHLRFQLEEYKKTTAKKFAEKLKDKCKVYEDRHIYYRLIDELLKEYENGKSL